MAVFLVSYESASSSENKALHESIRTFGDHLHEMNTTWVLHTNASAKQIWNTLKLNVEQEDKLLVVRIADECEWSGFKGDAAHWLNKTMKVLKREAKKASHSAEA